MLGLAVSVLYVRDLVLTALILLQSESVLIQKIYTHFKKTPGTHKLGVLYVVDSVTRQWVDQARKAGQPAGGAAQDGTFAAGVTRVTELLPVLMTDIINTAPEDQKVRLIDTSLEGSSLRPREGAMRLDTRIACFLPYVSRAVLRFCPYEQPQLTHDGLRSRIK